MSTNAFPIPGLHNHEDFNGLTKREYFAAMAMQAMAGMLSTTHGPYYTPTEAAHDAVCFADALLQRLTST